MPHLHFNLRYQSSESHNAWCKQVILRLAVRNKMIFVYNVRLMCEILFVLRTYSFSCHGYVLGLSYFVPQNSFLVGVNA